MIEILGIKYITDKEASSRYGFSQSWFQKRRSQKKSPKFMRLQGKGKVFYPIEETDTWFKDNIKPDTIY